MASFSSAFPLAYHAFPLHAAPGLVRQGALMGKGNAVAARPTTGAVDHALGFAAFVHLYLVRGGGWVDRLPILGAQLGPSPDPPFPHAVLELPTATVEDHEAVVCNWNLAVSRPGVEGVAKGGNWTRGTRPGRIREVWEALRATSPSPEKARGFFNGSRVVPTLEGRQLALHHRLMRRAPGGIPELLLTPPVPLRRFARVVAFSAPDADLLRRLGWPLPVEEQSFPGYQADRVPSDVRRQLTALCAGDDVQEEAFSSDRVRRRGR